MSEKLAFLLPLSSAILYVFGALLIKRAGAFNTGVWRTQMVANTVCGLAFLLLLPFGGTMHWDLWWQPLLVALLFFAGQFATLLSLDKGDVSVATPVLSLKIVLVAFFSTLLLGESVAIRLWIAAGLCTAGVTLLSRTRSQQHQRTGLTIFLASLGAAFYALFDVLVMKWSPLWGLGRFLPVMMGFVVLFSAALIPFFPAPLSALTRPAWKWLMGGAAFMALQSLVFVGALAALGNGTSANVVYSTRGLWSVLVVWWLGRHIGIAESQASRATLLTRLAGAALLATAVIIVLVG